MSDTCKSRDLLPYLSLISHTYMSFTERKKCRFDHVDGIMTTTVDKFTASDAASSLFFLSFQMEQHQGLYQVGDKVVYKEKKNSKNLP